MVDGYREGDLAKLCRMALEKSYGMEIPMPKCSVKKTHCRNPFVKLEQHWSNVIQVYFKANILVL